MPKYTHYTAKFDRCDYHYTLTRKKVTHPGFWFITLLNLETGELKAYHASLRSVFRIAQLLPCYGSANTTPPLAR